MNDEEPTNNQIRHIVMLLLGLITIWDTFTTIVGTTEIIGSANMQIFIAVIFAIMIAGLLIFTIPIWKNSKDDFIATGAKGLWLLALLYDFYTSFMANRDFIIQGFDANVHQLVITVGITIFVTSAPIGISYFVYNGKYSK